MHILVVCTANICRSPSAQRLLIDALASGPVDPPGPAVAGPRPAADGSEPHGPGPDPADAQQPDHPAPGAGDRFLGGIEVRSAGTHAVQGAPGCTMAPALAGHADAHRSTVLVPELLEWADLILVAARDHRAAVAAMLPSARGRCFTLRQAGRIADWLVAEGMVGAGRERAADPAGWDAQVPPDDPRREVAPMPRDPARRWAWLVEEMDVARGVVVSVGPPPRDARDGRPQTGVRRPERRWRGRLGLRAAGAADGPASWMHPDDVPDPHVHGLHLHPMAHDMIVAATDSIVAVLRTVATD